MPVPPFFFLSTIPGGPNDQNFVVRHGSTAKKKKNAQNYYNKATVLPLLIPLKEQGLFCLGAANPRQSGNIAQPRFFVCVWKRNNEKFLPVGKI